jgi:hypothetical protein
MVLPAELLRSYVPGVLASRFVARPMRHCCIPWRRVEAARLPV